jgi:transcriptional regulator with XRE-family HTH domain
LAAGLSQSALARLCGREKGNSWISQLEGKTFPRSLDDVARLAVALEVSPLWLLTGIGSGTDVDASKEGALSVVRAPPGDIASSKILDILPMNLIDIGAVVRARREELGLSQGQLARLSGLSRQTLVGLENGSLKDLGVNRAGQVLSVLGLDTPVPTTERRRKKNGLRMAARNANVSYARELPPDVLARMLVSGDVPAPYATHLTHLLDEAPLSMVVMAVEEAAAEAHIPPRKVWRNVARLAKSLSVHRKEMWVFS